MAKVIIYKSAKADMINIFDYIAQDNSKEALKMLDRFYEAMEQLERFPKSGTALTDKKLIKKGYRKIVIDNYILFYCIVQEEIQIRRVINGAMRYKNLLD